IAGRRRVELESLIGFFVNTLVLRTEVSGESSFRELLRRIREACLEAYAHQELPFEKLVEELQPERSLSYNPLFQVMFQLSTPQEVFRLRELEITGLHSETETTKIDLSLSMVDRPQGISGAFGYSTNLFAAETIERMINHFIRLLGCLVIDPEQRIAE